ncbi:hypothetical protein BJV82DRAFT_602896 [Fennellomyces sp. T-0311]|nr:hypothetical protein BJV82DRAFT_602896 [Fennellomyces sp. T-0311]
MAQDLELHIGSRQSHLPPGEIELRRRIAYVVCILDKTIAAAFDKPFTIKDDEFDVALPSVYETPLEDGGFMLEESNTIPLLLRQTEAAIREQQPVYTSFLRMISLAQMFGQVITSLYSTNPQKAPLADTFFIQSLDMALADWKRELQSSQHDMTDTICKGGVLNIFYNCIVLLLYRPLVMDPSQDESTKNTGQLVISYNMVSVNIIDMIEMSESLGVQCMPWGMVDYAVSQASMIFLYRAQSRDTNTRYQGYIHLLRCAKMYKNDDTMSRSRNAMLLEHAAQQVASTLGIPSSLGDIPLRQPRIVESEEPVQAPDSSVQQLHLATSTSPSTPSSSGTSTVEQHESSETSIQGQAGVDEPAVDIQAGKASLSQYTLSLTVGSPFKVTSQQPATTVTNISGVNQGLNNNTSSNMALLNYYLTALEIADQPPYPDESENPYRG